MLCSGSVSERRSVPEMIGEGLREMAILLLVFAPLDFAFAPDSEELTAVTIGAIVGLAVLLFVAGIALERTRT